MSPAPLLRLCLQRRNTGCRCLSLTRCQTNIKIYQNDKNGRSWTFRSGRLLNHFPRKGAVWSTFLRGRLGCQPGIQTTERCRPKRTRSPPSWRMPQWTHISQRYLDIRKGRESASEILPDNACSLYNRYIPTHIHSHWTLHTHIITYVTLDYVTFLYVPSHCAHTHTDTQT